LRRAPRWPAPFILVLLSACDVSTAHKWPVAPPYFYLGYFDDPREVQLFRCFEDGVCAADQVPEPVVFAAGANATHVVMARHPDGDQSPTEYYYIVRTPPDERGYGNRRTLFGPFTEAQFAIEKRRLGLPEFTIRPGL
jgi:hypothetical protein